MVRTKSNTSDDLLTIFTLACCTQLKKNTEKLTMHSKLNIAQIRPTVLKTL